MKMCLILSPMELVDMMPWAAQPETYSGRTVYPKGGVAMDYACAMLA